ncbi:MAG: Ig-like domain-containing protein, partial [Myxococcales bacterium]
MNRRFLSGSWLALVLACGGSSSTAPGAPDHVTATAGDAVVQVEWSAVAGAKSYTVYYDTAVSKGSPKVTTDATGAEIHGLTNGVAYQFAVTASNSSGESALSAIATATPQAPPPALTATVAPADGATGVSRNPQVQVVFGRAVDASTVSAITSGTDCGTSTVQLSADDFATCIAFASRAATAGDTTFTFTLGAPLAGAATYKLRLTIGIKDPAGVGLAHSTTATFTTAAALAVSATAPSGVDVAPLPSLSVTFNRAADASSVTVQTGAGACQGSLQLSSDGFTNCVALAAQPSTSDNRVFVVTPAAELALGTPYTLRVKASVRDSDGLALGADFDGAPFTTLAAFTLLGATPGDGDTGVPLRGPIVLRFNRAAMLSTVTTGAGCTGSVRIASGGLCEQGAVTANATGEVVTITPPPDLDALSPDAQYTLSVTAGVTDAAGHALSNPLAQATGFHTRLPTTLAISPADGAGPVPINTPIVLAFSRPVTGLTTNPTSSCTGASVVVTTGFAGACVPIDHVTVSGGTYTLHPAGYLPANKTLNVSIAGGAILDAVDGVHYQGDTSEAHGFTTGDVLSIDFTEPGDADTALARNTPISLFFNRAPLLSTLTTNTDTACDKAVQLSTDPDFGANTCVPMAAALPDNPAGTTEYDFKPTDPLSGSTTFYLRVVAGMVADDAGVSIARDLIMTTGFSTSAEMTVDATLTTHGTGLTPDVQPVVVFTRAPDPATIDGDCGTGSLFLEAPGGSCVAASVEKVDDLTWQILPAATLPGDQDYTIVVTTAVKDSDGVPLASEFRQSFHVRPALAVIHTTPADNATGQALYPYPIVIQFNRDVGTEAFDSDVSCTGTFEISSDG